MSNPPHYYNEFDPYAAQWLRNLMAAKLIPFGEVDERSIVEVKPDDLAGFRQCHFFAGIGGWALAARLAGWSEDRELWTGSPPCQPFSVAGRQRAQDDERHLWPHYFRLIAARRPAVLGFEQVAAAVGKNWLDGVFTDLESIGYRSGAVVAPACAVNAPHRRDRILGIAERGDVGDTFGARLEGYGGYEHDTAGRAQQDRPVAETGGSSVLAYTNSITCRESSSHTGGREDRSGARKVTGLECPSDGAMADHHGERCSEGNGDVSAARHGDPVTSEGGYGFWDDHDWIVGHDGKARRIPLNESGISLLAYGVSGRMAIVRPGFPSSTTDQEGLHWYNRSGALKGFGNAIVPDLFAELLGAYLDERP